MADRSYRLLRVFGPSWQPYECSDVPHGTTPAEIAAAILSAEGAKPRHRRTHIDLRQEDGSWARLNPAVPLGEQGVSDSAKLHVCPESTAGGSVELMLGALVGGAIVPFVQAISTKAGEDAYAAVRRLLGQRTTMSDEDIVLGDRSKKVVLRVPKEALRSSPPETELDLSVGGANSSTGRWQVVTWDPTTNRWSEELLDAPPPDTVFVRRRWWRRLLRHSRTPR